MNEKHADIAILGGGLGGVAAALAALQLGKRVILTEETDWLGGQLTAQAVPPDEHQWIEELGCSASYRRLRNGIRDYYRRNYPLTPAARQNPHLNPGMGSVSRLCCEPRVALAVIEALLAPYRASRKLEVLLHHRPAAAECDGDRIRAVTLLNPGTGTQTVVHAAYALDATELGDLLPLADVEHVIGSESQAQTGEPWAVEGDPQPLDQQSVTWCFAMEYLPGEDNTIARPEDYEFWRTYQAEFMPDLQLSWTEWDALGHRPRQRPLFDGPTEREHGSDYWHYRRIFYRKHYPDGLYPSDITLVNWTQNDYWLGPLVGVPPEEWQHNLHQAKQLSLSFLYWMQTEAPRHDGGYGYRGLRLREDIVGTEDGLAKYIYVRESRRIQAQFTVLEQHVGVDARGDLKGAEIFHDSIGIGSYRIDLHPSTRLRNSIHIGTWPFQIPLGALIPVRVENLLPACKNIGTTHVTNGCYRLHPMEWNIGEAVGALAAYCLDKGIAPRQVRNTPKRLESFQRLLTDRLGVELAWPEEQRLTPLR